jgi:hypothetical protein
MIKIPDCKNNFVYELDARTASIGIFNSKKMSFKVVNYSFGDLYIIEEDHWDNCNGTAKPIKELCQVDRLLKNDEEMIDFIMEMKIKYDLND